RVGCRWSERQEGVTAPTARSVIYTFDDFCTLVPESQKADLINGVIYYSPFDNTGAAQVERWLGHLLYSVTEERGLGEIFGPRVAFRLDSHNGPEPDIAFLHVDRQHLVRRGFIDGPPDVAVEIVSPESMDRDYGKKRRQYAEAGVPEYWIIDEIERTTT